MKSERRSYRKFIRLSNGAQTFDGPDRFDFVVGDDDNDDDDENSSLNNRSKLSLMH